MVYKLTQRRKDAKKGAKLTGDNNRRMRKSLTFTFIIFFVFIVSQPLRAQVKRGMMSADTLRFASVGEAQISPDGEWVVYTVSNVDAGRNVTRTVLWLARAGLGVGARDAEATSIERSRPAPSPLLPDGFYASNPRWSPDSRRLAFLAEHDGQSGIWMVSLTDRRPRFVVSVSETNFFITYAGEALAWSPDSRRIAFIQATEDEDEAAETLDNKDAAKASEDPRVIERIQYKSRTSFSDSARTHVWVIEVEAPESERQPQQLTFGPAYDHALTWSPDGKEIAFLSNHEPEPEANNNSDIFAVDMKGSVRRLTETRGCEYEPQWSPDGKWIAYTATKREVTTIDSVAEDTHVWVIDAAGGAGRELTSQQDRRARSPRWSPDSRTIFFLAGDRGLTRIFRVGLTDDAVRPLPIIPFQRSAPEERGGIIEPRPYQIGGFTVSNELTPALAFTLSDALHPAEVWVSSLATSALSGRNIMRRLSAHNDALLQTLTLVEPEEIKLRSFDGTSLQGWLMKPANFREGQRYPLILSVHGGPHGMYGWGFNAAFQAYAGRGYGVLYLNPRGSSGYGQKFSDGTLREWGGGDYRDLMAGVDEVLRKFSWIDPDRLGVTGGSYGGFMTNWIITQTTRFRAGVAAASVSNLISFYATSLYQDLIHAEFGGFPWEDYEQLWRWSPLRYARQAQTPLLLLHGEQDNDVHITQAEEMYMALRRRGVETVLVRYPREGHGFREPHHRQDALERTLAWFDRFLK